MGWDMTLCLKEANPHPTLMRDDKDGSYLFCLVLTSVCFAAKGVGKGLWKRGTS
jgi:hypothetical protein